jgi:type II secretory pathway pseudopilin PulG
VVVILIAAVVLVLAWPALKDALNKRQMTRTMNNTRELYLAGFHMATDGAASKHVNYKWPGDYTVGVATLADYSSKLVQNGYLKPDDLERILSAPGANCSVKTSESMPVAVSLSGRSALKIYKIKSTDPSTAIFAASTNYVYDTDLAATAAPFGDKGFVIMRKGGDAGVYKKNQATTAGWANAAEFQAKIGRLPSATDGSVAAGDDGNVLVAPQ